MKNEIYTCPAIEDPRRRNMHFLFLAGSITGAANWQDFAAKSLVQKYNIFNPRRAHYDKLIPGLEEEQITWEYNKLRKSRHILFWFSHETVAPITLFEYGAALERQKQELDNPEILDILKLYVGVHPDYSRKNDVYIQTRLINPGLKIMDNLEELVRSI